MSGRVLATPEAAAAIRQFQRIINDDLFNTINALDTQGKTLSDSNNWDGNLAIQFRDKWPEVTSNLQRVKGSLEDLRSQLQAIHDDIMRAGGNF